MHNLNLYSYYDKSLADINREYLESLKYKPKKVSRRKLDKKVVLAFIITALTGLGIANYMGVFKEEVVEVVEAPPPVDTRTEEEKQGYVQIQIFEFADTPVNVNTDNNGSTASVNTEKLKVIDIEKEKEKELLKENTKKTVVTQQVKKEQKPVAPAVVKQYSLIFENLSDKQYNKVKEIAANKKLKLNIIDAYSNTYSVWKVYEKTENGETIVNNEKVNHLEDFLTQEDAVNYANKRSIAAVIQQIGVTEKTYNIKVCCTDIEVAKNIAEQSNIKDKVIKIIREK